MQLKFQQDFFFRAVRGTDRAEILELVKKHQSDEAAQGLGPDFTSGDPDPSLFFQVILNSNGVLIGVLRIIHGKLDLLAVNPNFLKKELKEALFAQVREWCMAHTGGKLQPVPKLLVGDWKTFFKQAGAKFEIDLPGPEWIEF